MSTMLRLLMAGAIALAPSVSLAGPGSPNGPANGWDHLKGPDPSQLGQPRAECGDEDALFRPGNAEFAPGSAFNPDGTAGTMYAGEQPQNSRNTASVSQYDSACLHQSG